MKYKIKPLSTLLYSGLFTAMLFSQPLSASGNDYRNKSIEEAAEKNRSDHAANSVMPVKPPVPCAKKSKKCTPHPKKQHSPNGSTPKQGEAGSGD
jgi:hypothetical protein